MAESLLTDTSVTVTWNAVVVDGGVSEYEVFRDGVSIGTRVGTSFADTGLTADTTYSYTVTAKANNGEVSEKSAPLSVTTTSTPVSPVPDAPTGLVAGDTTDTTIDLNWDAVVYDGDIANYEVYRDGILEGSPVTNSFSDTGLTAETSYVYKVVAVGNDGQSSAESSELTISTTA